MAARFTLGLAEGGNFPAAVKTVSEWFPVRERALATGIFNSGSNIGAILTPLLIPAILSLGLGWPACFIITGSLGVFWLVAWLLLYRSPDQHPRVSPAELALIRSDPADPPVRIPWLTLLRYRPTWAFVVGMALSGPVWWFYLYWLPDFLHKRFDLDTAHKMPWPIIVVYLIADFGSVAGGWLSSALITRGFSVNAARKIAVLMCALCVTPVFFAPRCDDMWTASMLIALAASAHQGFACNLYTLVSDTMPRRSVSSIIGIGGFAAGLAGMGFQKFSGYILKYYPDVSYTVLFGIAAAAYLVALLLIQLLVPRIERVPIEEAVN
jgi:MFS transporter, ACS family, hexuronate transporter